MEKEVLFTVKRNLTVTRYTKSSRKPPENWSHFFLQNYAGTNPALWNSETIAYLFFMLSSTENLDCPPQLNLSQAEFSTGLNSQCSAQVPDKIAKFCCCDLPKERITLWGSRGCDAIGKSISRGPSLQVMRAPDNQQQARSHNRISMR